MEETEKKLREELQKLIRERGRTNMISVDELKAILDNQGVEKTKEQSEREEATICKRVGM